MAGSVNKVILIGHLGRDPQVRSATSGSRIVSFSIATSESWRDKASGERQERTEWHNIVIFNEAVGKLAEHYLRKGSKVYLEGQMRTRKYTDKEGAERYSTEVVLAQYRGELVLLDRSDQRPIPSEDSYGTTRTKPTPSAEPSPISHQDINDDIPF